MNNSKKSQYFHKNKTFTTISFTKLFKRKDSSKSSLQLKDSHENNIDESDLEVFSILNGTDDDEDHFMFDGNESVINYNVFTRQSVDY